MDKPKRQLTPEQLEKLAKAREKANEARRKNYEIKKFEKEQKKEEKHKEKIEKEKKRDEAVEAIIELKKEKQIKQQPERSSREAKPKAEPEPKPKEESEEEEEEYEPPPRKIQITKPPPPPKNFKKRVKVIKPEREVSESELYSKANIEMLRNKLYQQTRQRLMNDLFNY
jgi:hypothetical protein